MVTPLYSIRFVAVVRPTWLSLVSIQALLIAAAVAGATPVTVPPDLNPGDQYRLAFVTSRSQFDAVPLGMSIYNGRITAVAIAVPELAELSTYWRIIGSTSPSPSNINPINARDNTGTNPTVEVGVPIYLLNGSKLAFDNLDLWNGSIAVPLNIDEQGRPVGGDVLVWTGTASNGVVQKRLGGTYPTTGSTTATNGTWIGGETNAFSTPGRYFGMSGVLTVIPEPSTALLLTLGLVGMAAKWKHLN